MRRNTITQSQIIELTREVLCGFYGRNIDHLTHYLSDDFVWIGAFDFQFTKSKDEFLSITQSELESIPFAMSDEQYELLSRDKDSFILYCKFNLHATLQDRSTLQMHTRLTVVWKYIENALKLIHIHGSNAQDIPINVSAKIQATQQHLRDFLDYLQSTSKGEDTTILLRTTSGEHQVFQEQEILYLQSEGQNTLVHTKNGSVQISGILRTHQEKLTKQFFRIHKSYLVNLSYVSSLCRYQVTLGDRIQLPVSKERYSELIKQIPKQR